MYFLSKDDVDSVHCGKDDPSLVKGYEIWTGLLHVELGEHAEVYGRSVNLGRMAHKGMGGCWQSRDCIVVLCIVSEMPGGNRGSSGG